MRMWDYFPYSEFRKGQLETLKALMGSMLEGYKYFLLDAATGSGKSVIARTLCEFMNKEYGENSYILTGTKQLQDQYYEECYKSSIDYQLAKGRSNFNCRNLPETSCNDGLCTQKLPKFKCEFREGNKPSTLDECEYYYNKALAIESDVAIMNYDVLLSDIVNHYPERKIMVCDEAHNIENKIMQRISLTLTEKKLNKFNIGLSDYIYEDTSITNWITKLEELSTQLELLKLNHSVEYSNEELEELTDLIDKIESTITLINGSKYEWFVCPNKYDKKIMFKPLMISEYTSMLFDKAEFHLLMSGSIVDKDNFCKALGLDVDEVYYYKQESSFDIKNNNPIQPRWCGALTYYQKEKTLPKCYREIVRIMNEHPDEKGIIHCNSKAFAKGILENIDSDRFLYYNDSNEKNFILKEFERTDSAKVILAYSLEEGVNLPYDNIRFQIILKTPFPFLGDEQIKARKKYDPDWYILETIRKLIQIQGRGMRAEDDYCINYVLDSSCKGVFNNKLFPLDIKKSIKKIRF